MRELERNHLSELTPAFTPPRQVAIIGAGRLGTVIAAGLSAEGVVVRGPLTRPVALADAAEADVVLLCVPDSQIAAAAAALAPGRLVGHCSGATRLEVLSPHESFSMHPLMTVTEDDNPAVLRGAGAAIAGDTPRALAVADWLARTLAMRPIHVADADRVAYHTAASMAANFLITLEAAAERLAAGVGVDRALLVPLVRAAVENWARLGPERSLTGPVARGDERTIARQRATVQERAPELLALFDALVDATRTLVARDGAVA
jgi:predicted short-subunit dehydrogenase-like oxidoreductase (DUF2520 family)